MSNRHLHYKYHGCPYGDAPDIPELVGCKFTTPEYAELRGITEATAKSILRRYGGFYDQRPLQQGLSIPAYHDGISPARLNFHKLVTTSVWI